MIYIIMDISRVKGWLFIYKLDEYDTMDNYTKIHLIIIRFYNLIVIIISV